MKKTGHSTSRVKLTKSQDYLFKKIIGFYLKHDRSPNYRELGKYSDLSIKSVYDTAGILKRKGWLRDKKGIYPFDIKNSYVFYMGDLI